MIYMIIAAAVFLADILSKVAVAGNIEFFKDVPVIPGVLNLTNISNDGIAFGMLGGQRWLFMAATALLVIALALFIIKAKGYARTVYVSASLVLGGGLGNFFDRIVTLGKYDAPKCVVDFIDFCAFPKLWSWTFNAADIAVCVGVGIFALYLIAFDKKAYKNGFKAVLYEEKSEKNADK